MCKLSEDAQYQSITLNAQFIQFILKQQQQCILGESQDNWRQRACQRDLGNICPVCPVVEISRVQSTPAAARHKAKCVSQSERIL